MSGALNRVPRPRRSRPHLVDLFPSARQQRRAEAAEARRMAKKAKKINISKKETMQ